MKLRTEEAALREWAAPRHSNMTILLNFAGIVLVLATVGLYSVLAYSVTLRMWEIGIRIALGADPQSRRILSSGTEPVWRSSALPSACAEAFALTRFMQSLTFRVSPIDLTTFVAVSLLLIAAFQLSPVTYRHYGHQDLIRSKRLGSSDATHFRQQLTPL